MLKRVVLIFIFVTAMNYAQSAGNTGLSFLKLGSGARNIALADNGSSMSGDVTALFYNPARLLSNEGTEIMLMHNEWIEGIRSEILGLKFAFLGMPVGLGVNYTGVSDIEIRTTSGTPLGKFDAHYFFASLSSAFELMDDIKAGLTVKFINEDIFTDYASGYGFDFGVNYATPIKNLTASTVLRNIGSMSELRNEGSKLPAEVRIGSAYLYEIENYETEILVGAEVNKYLALDDYHINIASEISYKKLLSLRVGYQAFYESKGVTAGLGLSYGNFSFDYALTPFYYSLGSGHSFSVNFKFN